MWGVSEESDGLPGHRSLASLTLSLSPWSTAASAAGEGVLRAFVLHCTNGGCCLGWSLKFSGIISEQRGLKQQAGRGCCGVGSGVG